MPIFWPYYRLVSISIDLPISVRSRLIQRMSTVCICLRLDWCRDIPIYSRMQCGDDAITFEDCRSTGCCWDHYEKECYSTVQGYLTYMNFKIELLRQFIILSDFHDFQNRSNKYILFVGTPVELKAM